MAGVPLIALGALGFVLTGIHIANGEYHVYPF